MVLGVPELPCIGRLAFLHLAYVLMFLVPLWLMHRPPLSSPSSSLCLSLLPSSLLWSTSPLLPRFLSFSSLLYSLLTYNLSQSPSLSSGVSPFLHPFAFPSFISPLHFISSLSTFHLQYFILPCIVLTFISSTLHLFSMHIFYLYHSRPFPSTETPSFTYLLFCISAFLALLYVNPLLYRHSLFTFLPYDNSLNTVPTLSLYLFFSFFSICQPFPFPSLPSHLSPL